ncbi:hypothetical protein C8R44DRAFT_849894 [Mycena epipterygia]|nr:hypothetical protein C8R44DRAFT_849894 [Mycena epipterygia]
MLFVHLLCAVVGFGGVIAAPAPPGLRVVDAGSTPQRFWPREARQSRRTARGRALTFLDGMYERAPCLGTSESGQPIKMPRFGAMVSIFQVGVVSWVHRRSPEPDYMVTVVCEFKFYESEAFINYLLQFINIVCIHTPHSASMLPTGTVPTGAAAALFYCAGTFFLFAGPGGSTSPAFRRARSVPEISHEGSDIDVDLAVSRTDRYPRLRRLCAGMMFQMETRKSDSGLKTGSDNNLATGGRPGRLRMLGRDLI